MKKIYEKPVVEIENYEFNTMIATGCQNIVTLGPGDATHPICDEYNQSVYSLKRDSSPQELTFYEGSCSCYLSSVGSVLLTS